MNDIKIYCVIVTYNRLKLLKMAIHAVQKQTYAPYHIIVVDNFSHDGTSEYLEKMKDDRIKPILLNSNQGGAGGFYYGIKYAYEQGADWIWVMDDDSLPKEDALEKLMTCSLFDSKPFHREVGFFASRVNWVDGHKCIMNSPFPNQIYWDWYLDKHHGCYQIDHCSFVSMLINRKAVRKVGYPVKEFFIWLDDWEYSGRITSHFPAFYVPDSIVIHQLPENKGVDCADIDDHNLWRYKYEIRNQISYLTNQRRLGWLDAILFLVRRMVLMYQLKKSFPQQKTIMLSGIKGFLFNYKKCIEFPDS